MKINFLSNTIYLFTDGATRNNQSLDKTLTIGAFSYILYINGQIKEFAQAQRATTNNREELNGVINGLLAIEEITKYPIIVYTDSNYIVRGINENWLKKWKINGWVTSSHELVKNRDLWSWLDSLLGEFFFGVSFVHIKGHSDNEYNNRCDFLCNQAMDEFENRLKLGIKKD